MADTLFWHQNVGNGWGQVKIWEAGKPVEKDGDHLGVQVKKYSGSGKKEVVQTQSCFTVVSLPVLSTAPDPQCLINIC